MFTIKRNQCSRSTGTRIRDRRLYVVTEYGKPVARIVPCTAADAARATARSALLQRLAAQPAIDIGPWTRDALFER